MPDIGARYHANVRQVFQQAEEADFIKEDPKRLVYGWVGSVRLFRGIAIGFAVLMSIAAILQRTTCGGSI